MSLTDAQKREADAMVDADLLRQAESVNQAMKANGLARPDKRARVAVGGGRTAEAVVETLAILGRRPDVFDLGGSLVRVHEGRILPLDRHAAAQFFGTVIQYYRFKDSGRVSLDDPPARLVDQLLSPGTPRGLRPLDAVTTIPALRADGSVLAAPGYDAASRLLYVGDPVSVPEHPTVEQTRAAYYAVLFAFRDFPFVSTVDWAVMLAAIITAVIRPALPTAPAFAFDAPTVGSGNARQPSQAARRPNRGRRSRHATMRKSASACLPRCEPERAPSCGTISPAHSTRQAWRRS